jgi:hypothetical protein
MFFLRISQVDLIIQEHILPVPTRDGDRVLQRHGVRIYGALRRQQSLSTSLQSAIADSDTQITLLDESKDQIANMYPCPAFYDHKWNIR